MKPPLIALLSDFGLKDPYIGIIKGVISQISPSAVMVDLTHLVAPGDIQQGAFYLWQSQRDLPPGTVFLAVVDPGVGTDRKGIYLQQSGQIFIGPDNGLFSYLVYQGTSTAWQLMNPRFQLENASRTFHGRDIFAPVAAHAANGITGAEFGPPLESLVSLPQPLQLVRDQSLEGEIINQDRFGTLITSLGLFSPQGEELAYHSWTDSTSLAIPSTGLTLMIHDQALPIVSTFADIPPDHCAGLIGSTGLLEIAANQRSAREILKLQRGDRIRLVWD